MRYNILNLLAQMQYEAALSKTEEILSKDSRESYLQSIFVFSKMGDKAVPFLLKKIDDKNLNVRINAINVLGQWLLALEAAGPLQDRFWTEKNAEVRSLILSSLERIFTDLAQMQKFYEQVIVQEKDEGLVKFARETIDNMGQMKTDLGTHAKKKQVSADAFQKDYIKLFRSVGKKGSYEALAVSSTVEDEPKLKALRERILQRDSDEAFYDYQKVNNIIMQNRLLKKMTPPQPAAP